MTKLEGLNVEKMETISYDLLFMVLGGKINQIVEEVNELQGKVDGNKKELLAQGEVITINSKTTDGLLLQVSQLEEQVYQLWNTGFSKMAECVGEDKVNTCDDEVVHVSTGKRRNIVDNQTCRDNAPTPHTITNTGTDTNVGSKKDPLDQVDRALVTEGFKRGVKHAVEEFEKLRENNPNQTHWMLYNERSENMQDIYLYNDIPGAN